jgi:hypothetical protein
MTAAWKSTRAFLAVGAGLLFAACSANTPPPNQIYAGGPSYSGDDRWSERYLQQRTQSQAAPLPQATPGGLSPWGRDLATAGMVVAGVEAGRHILATPKTAGAAVSTGEVTTTGRAVATAGTEAAVDGVVERAGVGAVAEGVASRTAVGGGAAAIAGEAVEGAEASSLCQEGKVAHEPKR